MPPKQQTPASALSELQKPQPLKILDIAETLHPKDLPTNRDRNSAVSDDSEQNGDTHPAALEADLVHYKELFSKLRFSYVEQSTKEKFLRSITDNPPMLIESSENEAREAELAEAKAALKEQKQDVANTIKELEEKGRALALRYEGIRERIVKLEELPKEIEGLKGKIGELEKEREGLSDNPRLALPLPKTQELLQERQTELAEVNRQLEMLQAKVPARQQELEKVERELRPLEKQKDGVVKEAKEARRRREEGGGLGDELEERGRWLRASERGLREMLGVES